MLDSRCAASTAWLLWLAVGLLALLAGMPVFNTGGLARGPGRPEPGGHTLKPPATIAHHFTGKRGTFSGPGDPRPFPLAMTPLPRGLNLGSGANNPKLEKGLGVSPGRNPRKIPPRKIFGGAQPGEL